MNTFKLFTNLTKANNKRLMHYIPQLLTAVIALIVISAGALYLVSNNLFKEQTFSTVGVAYYLPNDDDLKYNRLALGMMESAQSMSEVASLYPVDTIDEGYELLDEGTVLFFIIVPESFFSGIMDSTNPSLTIVIENYSTMSTFIANELLMAYGRYLGIAQAGIYSALDTIRLHDENYEAEEYVLESTNVTYLERALNHERYVESVDAKDAGTYTLAQRYTGVIVFLTLCFCGFVLSAFLQNKNKGLLLQLQSNGMNRLHIFMADWISAIIATYISYLMCLLAATVYSKDFYPVGLIKIVPSILAISFLIVLINSLCHTVFAANITLFIVTLIIAYIGGCILPESFLPGIIRNISEYLPGKYILANILVCLF